MFSQEASAKFEKVFHKKLEKLLAEILDFFCHRSYRKAASKGMVNFLVEAENCPY